MAISASSDKIGGAPVARLAAAVNDPLPAEVGVSHAATAR